MEAAHQQCISWSRCLTVEPQQFLREFKLVANRFHIKRSLKNWVVADPFWLGQCFPVLGSSPDSLTPCIYLLGLRLHLWPGTEGSTHTRRCVSAGMWHLVLWFGCHHQLS